MGCIFGRWVEEFCLGWFSVFGWKSGLLGGLVGGVDVNLKFKFPAFRLIREVMWNIGFWELKS